MLQNTPSVPYLGCQGRGPGCTACGIYFPKPRPQQWKPGVLPTRLPWNSLSVPILKREFTISGHGILSNAIAASVEMIVWNPHHLFTVDGPCRLLVNLVCWEFLHQYRNLIQDYESWCSRISGKSSMEAVDKSENFLLQTSNSVPWVPRLKRGKFPISGWQLCAFLFLSPFLSTFSLQLSTLPFSLLYFLSHIHGNLH